MLSSMHHRLLLQGPTAREWESSEAVKNIGRGFIAFKLLFFGPGGYLYGIFTNGNFLIQQLMEFGLLYTLPSIMRKNLDGKNTNLYFDQTVLSHAWCCQSALPVTLHKTIILCQSLRG
jgi:hypothetical protein